MHLRLVEILRCPVTGGKLTLRDAVMRGERVESGWLVSESSGHRYVVRNFVPRFVPQSNYADNFGMQWNKFRRTQLDSYSGQSISSDRFWKATNWSRSQMAGQWVLDAGCGAGRFAEASLSSGAEVVALDYSSAVDACYANLSHHPNLHVVQGDIYSLPFAKGSFAYVYSLGVLQHTPDVARAVASLPPMAMDGGRLCIDFYERSVKGMLQPKYLLRPFTKRLPHDQLFARLERWVPGLLSWSGALRKVPVIGRGLARMVPVADYRGVLPLSEAQQREWSLLDTFDWLAPAYDNPQSARTLQTWLRELRLTQIEVLKAGHLVGRGIVSHARRN